MIILLRIPSPAHFLCGCCKSTHYPWSNIGHFIPPVWQQPLLRLSTASNVGFVKQKIQCAHKPGKKSLLWNSDSLKSAKILFAWSWNHPFSQILSYILLQPYPQATKPPCNVSHEKFLNEILRTWLKVPRPIYLPLENLLIDAKWMLIKEWRISIRGWTGGRGSGREGERREGVKGEIHPHHIHQFLWAHRTNVSRFGQKNLGWYSISHLIIKDTNRSQCS